MLLEIAILSRDSITNECAATLMSVAYSAGKMGHEVLPFVVDSCFVDEGRNAAFGAARESNADYLLFVDSDILVTGNMQNHLKSLITLNKDVTAAVYYTRKPPHRPSAMNVYGDTHLFQAVADIPDKPFQVDVTGCGFALISKRVLDAFDDDLVARIGKPFEYMPKSSHMGDPYREDISFCLRLKELGFEVWIDPSIPVAHVSKHLVTSEYWDRMKDGWQRQPT